MNLDFDWVYRKALPSCCRHLGIDYGYVSAGATIIAESASVTSAAHNTFGGPKSPLKGCRVFGVSSMGCSIAGDLFAVVLRLIQFSTK